jgi:tetratricopeptide (TPR) repeat protein
MRLADRPGVSWRLVVAAVGTAVAVAAPAVLAAAGVRLWWVLGLGVVVAAVAGVFAPGLTNSYRRAKEREEDTEFALARNSLVHTVREAADPLLLGVHPARSSDEPGGADEVSGRVPPYVPRDIHERLVELLAGGGFVLLVGDSTAGKSRAAYEAMRVALPDHTLLVPRDKAALNDAVERAAALSRCVLWLDNVQRFLGSDGLTRIAIARLVGGAGHHRVVLATLRSAEMARYTDSAHPDAADTAEVQQVLEQATSVRLRRTLSTAERERARTRAWDQRIADALEHTGKYGLAEHLAAGPELLNLWENAWEGGHPRAAALIAAAVDCRRAGLTRPLPRPLLEALHGLYLTHMGGDQLSPESLDDAWAWATRPQRATTALLTTSGDPAAVDVFDYLVDVTQQAATPDNQVPEQTLTGALAESDVTEASAIGTVAYGYGHHDLAARAFARAAERANADLGADHPDTLTFRSNRAVMLSQLHRHEEAEVEARAVLQTRIRVLGPEHPDTLTSRHNLASALRGRGEYEQAETELRAALEGFTRALGPDHASTLATRNALVVTQLSRGQASATETEARAVLDARIRLLGAEDPETLTSRHNLGMVLEYLDRYDEAEEELRTTLESRARTIGPDHPDTATTRRLYAEVLSELGRFEEAEPHARAALEAQSRTLGAEHPETLHARSDLGILLRRLERNEEAVTEHAAILEVRTRVLGPEHPATLQSRNNRAVALFHMGRGQEAVAEHRQVLAARTRLLGPEDAETLRSHANLAVTLGELGQFEEADDHARIALEARTRLLGPEHRDTANSRDTLAGLLRDQGRNDEADRIDHIR